MSLLQDLAHPVNAEILIQQIHFILQLHPVQAGNAVFENVFDIICYLGAKGVA
jgi:hypothetical protein